MNRTEERLLIESAAEGDRAAAERLIRAHQDSVFAYILRLSGRRDVAEDVTQEAFVRVLTHLDSFDPRFRFSTWVFTIARRLYVNAAQKLRPVYDSDAVGSVSASRGRGGSGSPASPPASGCIADEVRGNARDAIGEALAELTAEQREIVILFHQLNWPISVIAEHLDMPEGTVKSHLHRSRKRLRSLLEGSPRSTAAVAEVWE